MVPSIGAQPSERDAGGGHDGSEEPETIEVLHDVPSCQDEGEGELPVSLRTAPLVVDGRLDEVSWRMDAEADRLLQGASDNRVSFAAQWDEVHLFLGIRVHDEELVRDSSEREADDSVEVTIGDALALGVGPSESNLGGLLHGWVQGEDGYTVELAIPWGTVGLEPAAGLSFAFDLENNDDDDGGGRDGQLVWCRGTGQAQRQGLSPGQARLMPREGGAQTVVQVYEAPTGENALPLYDDFVVQVQGQPSPVYRLKVNTEHAFTFCQPGQPNQDRTTCPVHLFATEPVGMTYFDVDGSVSVRVQVRNRPVRSARVFPSSVRVNPEVQGDVVTLELPGPGKYELQVNDAHSPLYLFVNPLEVGVPKPGDVGVLYFGPGVHEAGLIELGALARRTVYVAGGALVRGRFKSDGHDGVTIRGRGIIDGSWVPRPGRGGAIVLGGGDRLTLEGVILSNSGGWTVKLFHATNALVDNIKILGQFRQNADGIDISNSRRVEVRNVFIRSNDDGIIFKGFGDCHDYCAGPTMTKYSREENSTSDVWIHDSVVTSDLANGILEFGYELHTHEISNVRIENIDIPRAYSRSIVGFHAHEASDALVLRGIRFENIRVEDYQGGDRGKRWFEFTMRHGTLSDVVFSNVYLEGGVSPGSHMSGDGAALPSIRDVTFRGVRRDGRALTTPQELGFDALGDATNVTVEP